MTLLQKIGSIILKVAEIGIQAWTGIPLLNNLLPASSQATAVNVEDKLQAIFNGVITAEQVGQALTPGLTGSQKLQVASRFVIPIINTVETVAAKKPKDEAKFEQACVALTSAVADILNSFGD